MSKQTRIECDWCHQEINSDVETSLSLTFISGISVTVKPVFHPDDNKDICIKCFALEVYKNLKNTPNKTI